MFRRRESNSSDEDYDHIPERSRHALEYNIDGPRFEDGEFRYFEVLGQGHQGTVVRAQHTTLGACALKKMHIAQSSLGRGASTDTYLEEAARDARELHQALQLLEDTQREFVTVQKACHHDKIIGFRGYLTRSLNTPAKGFPIFTGIVFEFMPGGTLENLIKNDPNAMKYNRVLDYSIGIARALTFLHENLNIIHRHIHPSNILLTADLSIAKLGGFGFARENSERLMSSNKGDIRYMAPEVIHENELAPYGLKSDVWSLAMLLYTMLCKREPTLVDANGGEITNMRLRKRMLRTGERPVIENSLRRTFPDMVARIEEGWQTDPQNRPSMMDMLKKLEAMLL